MQRQLSGLDPVAVAGVVLGRPLVAALAGTALSTQITVHAARRTGVAFAQLQKNVDFDPNLHWVFEV